jgi:DNA-binding response OmpR family regulator
MEAAVPKVQRSILLVEDEAELSTILQEHFVGEGYRVEVAENGAEALRRVMQDTFDVIICDMVLPRLPGNMFYNAVQRVKPELCDRFLFITGHGESPGVREFLATLRERVISKPFNLEDLVAAVRDVAAGPGEAARQIQAG